MTHRTIGRIATAVIFGVLFASALHLDHLKGGRMGREEFLTKQAARFDRHFAKPDPIAVELFVCSLMAGGLFSAYELMALGISKALKRFDNHDTNS